MSEIPSNIILPDTAGDTHPVAAAYPQKGDIKVFNGLAWVTLPVGANDTVLTADSSAATGLKWNVNAA